jgi:hypothetical protein
MFDSETQREIIMLKAKDLEISDEALDKLDQVVCKMLGIDEPEPLILEV